MSGPSIMCDREAVTAERDDHVFEPEGLTDAQVVGDACVVCHTRWPRPRHPLGLLSDGARVYGCAECARLAAESPNAEAPGRPVLVSH